MNELSKAALDVLAERRRHVDVESWTSEHDDKHYLGEMACAAGAYCLSAAKPEQYARRPGQAFSIPLFWPWHRRWWKPSTPRRDLVKAGALILAEIERLDRIK